MAGGDTARPRARAPVERPGADPRDVAVTKLHAVTETLSAGETRSQQIEMCRAVARAIDSGRHLIVQAGTGTGKSLAYLVPAIASGKKVVVATATKALQDQLGTNDLPLIGRGLPDRFSYAVLKGRSNYLCRQRAAEMGDAALEPGAAQPVMIASAEDPESPAEPVPSEAETERDTPRTIVDQVRRLLEWSEHTDTGDRASLDFEPSPRAWAMVSVGPRECPGAFKCPSGGTCFAEAARAKAAAADVVVVNTHLYGTHLVSGGAVLPPHDVVVFDEAHELEEVMTSSLGAEIAPGRIRGLVAMARPLLARAGGASADTTAVVDALGEVADRLEHALAGRVGTRVITGAGSAPAPEGRERTRRAPGGGTDQELADLLALGAGRVGALVAQLRRGDEAGALFDAGISARRARALSAATHLAEDVSRMAGRADTDVLWVDGTSHAPVLRLSPIDVGPALSETLWCELTAVLTSATMPPGMRQRVGLVDHPTDELDVGSPFDFRTHGLLYVARHLPDRRDPASTPALHAELEALIDAAGGRTLALFTSRRATEEAARALGHRFAFRVYLQDELPKPKLLEAFAREETSCLFATLGFWQGVDIPGPSLSLVTLDRLPFARPDDPLLEARRERAGDDAFRVVDLPRAATLLAQGAGRLIRSATDRGVVAVLDSRLATAGYRGVLLATMPPMRRTTDRRQVEDFFAALFGPPGPQ